MDKENEVKKKQRKEQKAAHLADRVSAAPSNSLWTLPLTVRDKWPLKSHDHLIHLSLAINCALTLQAGTYYRGRNSLASIKKTKKNHPKFVGMSVY